METRDAALAGLLRRDRAIVLAALIAITLISWAHVLWLAASMSMAKPAAMMAPAFMPWTPTHFLLMFAMWAVMMVGMMTPSVAPMVLLYTQVARQAVTLGKPFAPAAWFASGYLVAWTGFSLLATLAQWALESVALMTPMAMTSTSALFGGAVLIAAGIYQWTPLKEACLSNCRAPLSFVQQHGGFQASASGSLRLGLLHGAYCIGCCWALMALLFVGGVMNILWIAALMVFVLAEKVVPGGRLLARLAGAVALVAGLWMLASM